ncbi:MAG TPA: hypothetical protein VFE84_12595, partial [Patescibacteria group bacterium]|nr:hypothetical protein [Patescibacteria group bacterium]
MEARVLDGGLMAIAVFPRVASRYARNYGRLRRGHWSTQGLVLCCPRASLPVSTEGIRTLGAYSSAAAVFQHPEGINFTDTA